MDTTFSVYYIRLRLLLNKIQAAQKAEKEENWDYVMECVRWSFLDQYPLQVAEINPGALCKRKPPYISLAAFHEAFEKATPSQYKAENQPLVRRTAKGQETSADSGSRPRSSGNQNSSENSQSLGQAMSVSSPDPLATEFEGWPASDAVWPIVCTISNSFL